MTHLFHGIVKMTIAKWIHIKLINNKYKYKSKNDVNLKKILIIYNTNKCFGITVKLDIVFTIFNGKNGKKMLFDLMNKKKQKFVIGKQC